MTQGMDRRDGIAPSRACLIAVLITLLIFPPSMFGDPITWTGGGDGTTYGDVNNWDLGVVPNNGGGVGYDVSIQSSGGNSINATLDNIEQGLDAVTVNSMSIRGGNVAGTATLNVGGSSLRGAVNLTIGTPGNTQGNALDVGNRGTLNVGDPATSSAGAVTLDLSGGGGFLPPGQPNSVGAYIENGGSVNVLQGGTLLVQNGSGGTRAITNNGAINVALDGPFASLQFSNEGIPGTFVLTGSGSVTLAGLSGINGTTGTENLINDYGHTIVATGLNSIGGGTFVRGTPLGGFTNNGTLAVIGGAQLVVGSPLTNYNTVTGKLTNGTYDVENSSDLVISSVGSGNSISSLNLVNMQLSGPGAQITGSALSLPPQQPSGQGSILGGGSILPGPGTSAIAGLTYLKDSSLDLQGVNATIVPSNASGTLTLRSDPLGLPTNLTVESDSNGNTSIVEIAGNVKNISATGGAPEPGVMGSQGSTITVTGAGNSLQIDGDLSNKSYGTSSSWSGLPSNQYANSNVNVTNGGTLTVGGSVITQTNTYGNSFINVYGYDSNLNPTGATMTVNGNLRNGGGFGNPMSSGADVVAVQNGTLTVNGNFTNNNNYGTSSVYVGSGGAVNVTGWYGQFQGSGGNGQSILTVDGGQMTVGNLRNSTGALAPGDTDYQPQSQINVTNGGSLTINGNFANIDGNGVLTGGSYTLGGPAVVSGQNGIVEVPSTLNYNGANITAIGALTSLSFDTGDSSLQGQILNGGSDAISGSLNEVAGRLTLNNGAGLNLTSAQGLTIDAGGQVSLNGWGSLGANSLQNNGSLAVNSSGNSVTVGTLGNLSGGVLTGGSWNLNGALNFGVGEDGTSTAITGLSGAIVGIGPNGGFFNNGTDALTGLNSITNGTQLGISGQTRSFGPLTVDGSTGSGQTILTLANGSNVTFNGPSGSSGVGLSVVNNAIMNVNQSTATLNLGGGNTALIGSGGTLSINDGSTLALVGGTSDVPGVVTLDGGGLNIQGSSAAGTLSVSDGGTYQINNTSNGGSVSVNGLGQISVSNGSNLAINATLNNLGADGGSGLGTLNGGQYIVGDGSTLQLTSAGFQELNGANVSVSGTGLLTSDGTTNAVAGMTQLNSLSSLTLHGVTGPDGTAFAMNPGNTPGGDNTFVLSNNLDAGGSGAPTLSLRDGSNVQLNGSFQSYGGNLNITNGSSMTVGFSLLQAQNASQGIVGSGHTSLDLYSGTFYPIDSNGSLGAGGSSPINLTVGSGSSLIYNGADIFSIDTSSSLTLGNREGAGTGTIQNLAGGQHDALSGSLNTVYGTLNLQNGAQLTLQAAAGSFQASGGSVNLTNGSTLDVSSVSFGNVDSNGNLTGNYLIGSNSVLNYSGPSNITNIDGSLTLDNTNMGTTGMITNGTGNDALSGSLASVGANNVGATLTVQNNANLTLTGSSFRNFGAVNVTNNSMFDVSGMGSGFLDVDSSGNQYGNYLIGSGSALNYSGANINTINGVLTLDNSNSTALNPTATGMITNGGPGNDALSNSLTTINGELNIQNNAQVELNNGGISPLTLNEGAGLSLDHNGGQGGSTLTIDQKLVSTNANINVGSDGQTVQSQLIAVNGLSNTSNDNNSDNYGNSQITVNHSSVTVGQLDSQGNVTQVSNFFNGGFATTAGLGNGGYSNAELDLYGGSQMLVTGNLKNLALGGSVFSTDSGEIDTTANASINLYGGSALQVNGNVRNVAVQGQNGAFGATANASLNIDGGSTLTVNGTYTNFSGSGGYGNLASLNLTNNSTATVSGLFTNSGESLVDLDDYGASGSTLNANGGFQNYNSGVFLNSSSTLNVQNGFLNLADDSANSAGYGFTLLEIGGGGAPAQHPSSQGPVLLTNSQGCCGGGGSSVATITGGLINSASTSNGGQALSTVQIDPGGILNVDNLTNSAMVATPGGNDYASATVSLFGGTLNVTGNLTNSSSVPFFQNVNLPAPGSFGFADAEIDAAFGTINVGGSLTNTNARVQMVEGNQLNAFNGVLNLATDSNFDGTPRGASVSLSGFSNFVMDSESGAWIGGGLTNSAAAIVGGYAQAIVSIADGSQMTVSAPTSSPTQGIVYALTNLASASTTDAGPGVALAVTTIANSSGLTVNGNVLNMSVTPGASGGAVINVVGDGLGDTNGGSTLTVTGTFNNTAATLNVSGGSTATIAGLFTNDSNSSVNLNANDQPTIGGGGKQGTITSIGHTSSDSGSIVLPATVLYSNGGFNNGGYVSLNDNTALVNTGTFLNTGSVTIGSGAFLVTNSDDSGVNLYSQTSGTTLIYVGGTLQADSVSITGGAVNGDNNGSGPTSATIIGNVTIGDTQGETNATLNLGDPMSLDVVGTYDQTMLGILTLDFESDQAGGWDSLAVTSAQNVDPSLATAILNGQLDVTIGNDFTATVGEVFDIINATGGVTDNLTYSPAMFGNGLELVKLDNGPDEVDLEVEQVVATPEPGTLSMLFCAMLIGGGVTWYRRKRKNIAE